MKNIKSRPPLSPDEEEFSLASLERNYLELLRTMNTNQSPPDGPSLEAMTEYMQQVAAAVKKGKRAEGLKAYQEQHPDGVSPEEAAQDLEQLTITIEEAKRAICEVVKKLNETMYHEEIAAWDVDRWVWARRDLDNAILLYEVKMGDWVDIAIEGTKKL
jgi:hypothetical protein